MEMKREEVAQYIATHLAQLREIALRRDLTMLIYLLEMAETEARDRAVTDENSDAVSRRPPSIAAVKGIEMVGDIGIEPMTPPV